ncbi:MAG: PspC family transcriptional regulator [Bacteroidota bacterium]
MKKLRDALERSAFGVCAYIGEKMRLPSARVRIYFIYISFITLGSPIIFYLFVVFWMNIKQYLRRGKHVIWQ